MAHKSSSVTTTIPGAWIPESPREAEEILNTALTEDDLETLKSIRYDLNAQVNWRELVRESFPAMVLTMETILFEPSQKNTAPVESLFPAAQDWLEEPEKGEVRRHFLTLLLLKKLLGALKTRVNKELQNIPQLTLEQELDLRDYAQEKNELQEEGDMLHQRFDFPREGKPHIRASMVRTSSEYDAKSCPPHVRIAVTKIHRNGKRFKRTYCKDCRRELSLELLTKETETALQCQHKAAEWVEGQEGKVAKCSAPNCDYIMPNPEKFLWREAGLEPFGDDPGADEVVVLNEVMS